MKKNISRNKTNPVQGSFYDRMLVLAMALVMLVAYSCSSTDEMQSAPERSDQRVMPFSEASGIPSPDPRIGLAGGLFDAEEAIWNLNMLSTSPPGEDFLGVTSSDLAFTGNYAIQGNYNGFMIWDITNPEAPELVVDFVCPASQSDVSVFGNLLFVSGEGLGGRLDCGTEGVDTAVSEERLRGIRIFDISNIYEPEYISNVQTCRGSHTHSVLESPNDLENVYVYVSGSAPVRPEDELPGCVTALPEEDEDSALFRIEVIKVPLNAPETAHIVSSPRIFEDLEAPPRHGLAPEEMAAVERAIEEGRFVVEYGDIPRVLSNNMVNLFLEKIVEERDGTGEATAADSTVLRDRGSEMFTEWMEERLAARGRGLDMGPNQCHDITLYPAVGLAGGACEGYGLLLDINDPANPFRVDAVADSNFAYWHSATFNNDGTTVIFTDEWGGGTQPKCRETDPYEWGANAIYSIDADNKMIFQSYFKMPAPQTSTENCVAHNGSIIPVPGRDIMVQAWYQGGINVFDFTDPANPFEIAFHDRGPVDEERLVTAGSWSVYWYNGLIVSSEIARGLDIFELVPSEYLTANEIAAANTVHMEEFNPQGQPKKVWPTTFHLAHAYLDQIERDSLIPADEIASIRKTLKESEQVNGNRRSELLNDLAFTVADHVSLSGELGKIALLSTTLENLAAM